MTGHEEFRRTAQGAMARSRLPVSGPQRTSSDPIRNGPGRAREAAMFLLRAAMRDAESRERHLVQARTALTAVLGAIDARIAVPRFDATIRDGLAGLGAVLLTAVHALDDRSYLDRSRDLAQTLIDRYSEQDNWPTGFPGGGPNPSLFSGTAGIGYWLLRLDEPERVPCWLFLEPADVDDPASSAPRETVWPPGWSHAV